MQKMNMRNKILLVLVGVTIGVGIELFTGFWDGLLFKGDPMIKVEHHLAGCIVVDNEANGDPKWECQDVE